MIIQSFAITTTFDGKLASVLDEIESGAVSVT
jgi:hypothetical protein